MISATYLKSLLNCDDLEILLYGYTLSRQSTYVFISGDKLVRVTENRDTHDVQTWEESIAVRSEFFGNVKRWYANATNETLRDFVESFGGLSETPGGSAAKGDRYYGIRPTDSRLFDFEA